MSILLEYKGLLLGANFECVQILLGRLRGVNEWRGSLIAVDKIIKFGHFEPHLSTLQLMEFLEGSALTAATLRLPVSDLTGGGR
ncbi:hypothetical protein OUZ56_005378 [Daphnia magna]|uniref:Uncharacterized protein n=1 Tax=Daphnia magna TaxID=35525 RepID=A0ABQ9YSM7_9CRUS|nr:hypothetical protein OUZ56_005378 [Daphnia magna]